MTLVYTIPTYHQGPILYWARLVVGTAMVGSIILGVSSILRRQVARHEDFMIRAYALGQGAGTQAFVLGPWMLISGESEGLTRDLLMTLAWAINAAVAEVIIKFRERKRSYAKTAANDPEASPQPGAWILAQRTSETAWQGEP